MVHRADALPGGILQSPVRLLFPADGDVQMKPLLRMLCGFAVLAYSAAAWAQQPQPIVTNQPGFRIPYRFDQAEMRRLRAKEIRLFLSRNAGSEWRHVQTVAPEVGRFDFKAAADGEYWFAVRTLDGANQLHPDANVVEPGLVVIVDRTPPDLQLLLQQSEAGKVQLSWSVSDTNLDPTKLTLEFSQGGANWLPVSVKAQAAGQTSWSVPSGGQVTVHSSRRTELEMSDPRKRRWLFKRANKLLRCASVPMQRTTLSQSLAVNCRRCPNPPATSPSAHRPATASHHRHLLSRSQDLLPPAIDWPLLHRLRRNSPAKQRSPIQFRQHRIHLLQAKAASTRLNGARTGVASTRAAASAR